MTDRKTVVVALLCTLGAAACGKDERPAQSPPVATPYPHEGTTTTGAPTTSTYGSPQTPTGTTSTTGTPSTTTGTPSTTGTMGTEGTMGTQGTTGTTSTTGTSSTYGGAPSTMGTSPPMGAGANDQNITAALRRSIVNDNSLSFDAKNVRIDTVGGKVTLRGTVNNQSEKSMIESKAKSTPGVTDVDNKLDVKK